MSFGHKHLIDITEYSDSDIMTILETAKGVLGGQRAGYQEGSHAQGQDDRQHVQRALDAHPVFL